MKNLSKNLIRGWKRLEEKDKEKYMKKIIILLLLITIIATPSYALNIIDRIIYTEVKLGQEKVLVNNFTGKVEKILVNDNYEPISTEQGWGGIISDQEMYQAQYEKAK